jgi:hypothetical protein
MLVTVVELPEFVRRSRAIMTDAERMDLIALLASDPETGVSLGGGLRKVRFGRDGGGKSGGFRTIHFYRAGAGPVFLLTMFAKNEKANLTPAELAILVKLGDQIAAHYRKLS